MRVIEAKYEIDNDGVQMLHLMLEGNCEEKCRKLESDVDSGQKVEVFFSQDSKRSLDSNALYWLLTGRIAKAIGSSLSEVHNLNLRRYGVPFTVDDKIVYAYLEDSVDTEKSVLQNESVHLKPTSSVREGNKGKMYRAYMVMKGSKDLTRSEMATLIDGVISECKEMGLEYRKPWEL